MAAPTATMTLFLFFFFVFLFTSLQARARDSQFFSKVTRETTNNNNNADYAISENTFADKNHVREAQVPAKEQRGMSREQLQQDHDEEVPAFMPQTAHNGYGLYGHETATTTTTTKSTNEPQYYYTFSTNNVPENEEPNYHYNYNTYNNGIVKQNTHSNINMKRSYDDDQAKEQRDSSHVNCRKHNNGKNYAPELRGLDGYSSDTVDINQNRNNNHNKRFSYSHSNEEGRQGMSNTRFVDNDQYLYDINTENERGMNNNYYNGERVTDNIGNKYLNNNNYYNNGDGEVFNRYYRNNDAMQRGHLRVDDMDDGQDEDFDLNP